MRHRAFVTVLTVLIAIVTGCAGPSATSGSAPVAATSAPASELIGTWHGSFGWHGGSHFYMDEANLVLQIRKDGTFTETVTPAPGSNNLAKRSTWSGTVVTRGNRVTLRSSQGPWVTLVHSGNTLYGVAEDPVEEFTIMIRFDRDGSGT